MKGKTNFSGSHESYARAEEDIPLPSNRSFGLVFAGFFTLAGLVAGWRIGWGSRSVLSCGGLALMFLLTALAFPGTLSPLNRLWMRFGLLLHSITTPVLLGLVFFFVVTPLGWVAKILGKDFLRLRRPAGCKTYWIDRTQLASTPESLRRQF